MAEMTFVNGLGCIAQEYGLKEAVFLHNLIFWVRVNRSNGVNFKDGRWWSYNTFEGLAQLMPWWTAKQIRAIVKNCEDKGALLIGDYNENRQMRTLWYSPSDKVLAVYGDDWSEDVSDETICPFGQTERAEPNAQTGKCLIGIKNNNKKKTPIAPSGGEADLFDRFWARYPRKQSKQAARRAWDKLRPDLALCRTMDRALRAQMASEQWTREGGRFVPLPATWLNGRRWEDELQPERPAARVAPAEPERMEDQWLT